MVSIANVTLVEDGDISNSSATDLYRVKHLGTLVVRLYRLRDVTDQVREKSSNTPTTTLSAADTVEPLEKVSEKALKGEAKSLGVT